MSEDCPGQGELVDIELGRIATQYREAKKLKGYMAAVLGQIEDVARRVCVIPEAFNLMTAVGEQLTFVGRRMGFPRCHCVCDVTPLFGFACDGYVGPPVVGMCAPDGTWMGCEGVADICIADDDAYRRHLLARRYQMLGLFDIESLGCALKHLWGPAAWVVQASRGRVVIAPGRNLTPDETRRLSASLRALPFAPGVQISAHFGSNRVFGFGQGWAGMVACSGVGPNKPVFGFSGPGCIDDPMQPVSGLCDDGQTWFDCLPTAPASGHWLCPTDLDPYRCGDPPGAPLFGFESGDDEGPAIAGFGDETSTWAACLS